MAEQSPFVSSSSGPVQAQAAGGGGGSGSAFCTAASSSSSSSSPQPLSLFAAPPAAPGGTGTGLGAPGAFLPPPPPCSSSSGPPPGKDAESPESPFEVVPDRAAFDREFGAGPGSVLSQIPEDRICDFAALPRPGAALPAGRLPPGLCRQSSGTAAALEEVSKCVRDLHSFTSEMLTWHLVGTEPGVEMGTERGMELGTEPGSGAVEADSSGDSDDTVIEEGSAEDLPPSGANRSGATPSAAAPAGATSPPAAAASPVPKPPPPPSAAAAARREREEEQQKLQELGEPPRGQPEPPRAPPAPQLLLPSLAARELLLWQDARRSGAAFGASLLLLLSLATLSAISVLAHLALALLCVTISLRVYRAVVQALQKADEGHPFRAYLELDLTLSPEAFHALASAGARQLNRALRRLQRLLLVEDLVDSIKLAVAMWLLTYVGAVFNGITLLILADLLAFTLPPLYQKYKVQIDHSLDIARQQIKDLLEKLQAKLPGLAKKKSE